MSRKPGVKHPRHGGQQAQSLEARKCFPCQGRAGGPWGRAGRRASCERVAVPGPDLRVTVTGSRTV